MNKRIKEVRKELGLTQDEFAAKLGLTRGAITNIELNKTEPKPLLVNLICSTYNVNEYWLRTGNGEMFEEKTDAEEIMRFAMEVIGGSPNSTQATFIKALAKLTPAEWEVIQKIIDNLTENKKWPDESDPE